MLTLAPLPQSLTGDPRFDAGISDLLVIDTPDGPALMSVTGGHEGGITTYDLAANRKPQVTDTTATGVDVISGTGPDLVATDDGRMLVAGLDRGAVRLGLPETTLTERAAGSGQWSLAASTGTTLVLAESDGSAVSLYSLTGTGGMTRIGTASGGGQGSGADLGAMALCTIGGQDILITASTTGHSVGTWLVGSSIRPADSNGPTEGLGIMIPTDIAVVQVGGQHMVLLASAPSAGQSGALTVLGLDARGTLTPLDHVTDSLGSRFGQVQSLAITEHDGRTLVAAGGGDDGISLFTLTDTGRLIHLTAFEDTADTRLTGITALEMSVHGDRLQIHAASGEGQGVTTLSADLSRLGQIRQAGDGGDHLHAGRTGDILIDGTGADRLTGGAGGDLVVIGADGQRNRIDQFDPTKDHIDLGNWPLLYDVATLDIRKSGSTILIEGRGQVLEVTGTTTLTPDAVRAAIVLSASRSFSVPETVVTGGGGADDLSGTWGMDTLRGGAGNDTLAGGQGDDVIDGGTGHDRVVVDVDFADTLILGSTEGAVTLTSSQGRDVISDVETFVFRDGTYDFETIIAPRPITGTDDNDILTGTPGSDRLALGGGDDTVSAGLGDDDIRGQGGRDNIWGQGGDDMIDGGAGADTLRGGPGMDRIDGGTGNDVIRGQKHADTLYGGRGDDNIKGGGGGDEISGGAGRDFLKGGTRNDVIYGGDDDDILAGNRHDDVLNGGDGADRLRAGDGHDSLTGGGGDDILKGGTGADTFVFRSGDGADTILDFDTSEDILQLNIVPEAISRTTDGLLMTFDDGGSILFHGLTDSSALSATVDLI